MQEFVSLRPQPHLSENYFPALDYIPETYSYTVNQDLGFVGKNYNTTNDGFRGIITFTELVLIARAAMSRDPNTRLQARRRLQRYGRSITRLAPRAVY